jgi:hypothetical protein
VKLISVTPANPTPLGAAATTGKQTDSGLSAPGSVQVIGVTLTISGPFANTRLFLTNLEAMPRSFLVTGLAIGRDTGGSSTTSTTTAKVGNPLTTTITGRVFKANAGVAAAVGTTAGGSSSSTVKNS